jgi:hypothetical protein
MAPQFAGRHFLRMARNSDLEVYSGKTGFLAGVSFEARDEADIDDIWIAWQTSTPEVRAQIDVDFRDIDSLATAEGAAAFVREGKQLELDLEPEFAEKGGFHDKSFTAFLKYRDLFDRVLQLSSTEALPTRYWSKRNDLPRVGLRTDEQTMANLGSALRYYFKEKEGRGQTCVVESCESDGLTYFFCYLEDYGRTELGFGSTHQLERRTSRPAFEVIFIVSLEHRSLDTFFFGSRQTVKALETLFSRAIFGFDLPEFRDETVYELNQLKQRGFPWIYDLASGIVSVAVLSMQFNAIGGIKRRKTLDADPTRYEDIYDFIDDDFDTGALSDSPSGRPPLAAFNVAKVKMQVKFEKLPRRRQPSVTFFVSFPNGCSLKHDDKHAIIREMLRQSGIERRSDSSPQRELVGVGTGAR